VYQLSQFNIYIYIYIYIFENDIKTWKLISYLIQLLESFKYTFYLIDFIEINFSKFLVWFSYLKGIQDLGVFVCAVISILIFLGQTVLVCQSYNAGLWSPPQRACTEMFKLNMICFSL